MREVAAESVQSITMSDVSDLGVTTAARPDITTRIDKRILTGALDRVINRQGIAESKRPADRDNAADRTNPGAASVV